MPYLRWIAALPTALLAYAYVQLLVIALGLLLPLPENVSQVVDQTMGSILCPYYFVLVGSRVAPGNRSVVALALLALSVLFDIAITVIGSYRPEILHSPLWWLVVSALLSLISGGVAAARVISETRDGVFEMTPERRWYTPLLRVAAHTFGLTYAYGYFGQAVLFIVLLWGNIGGAWVNLISPLLFVRSLFGMLFTPYFWMLVSASFIGYFGMTYFTRKLEEVPTPAT